MQSSLVVITPAQSESLVSLYEAKLALNLQDSTVTTTDDQVEMLIEWSSSEIASLCNRVFALETVTEKFTQVDTFHNRIYLTRYPVVDISAMTEDGAPLVQGVDYDLDSQSGLITRTSSAWGTPLVTTYKGGYELPNAAPRALRQAALLLTREAYNAIARGDASIRMVSHKDSRVIYFDPNAKTGAAVGGGSPARRAIGDLLTHFTRFAV